MTICLIHYLDRRIQMDILNSLLSEEEVMEMSDECLTAFIKVLDIRYIKSIASYIKEGRKDVSDKLIECGKIYIAPMIILNEILNLPTVSIKRLPTLVKEVSTGDINLQEYSYALDAITKYKDEMTSLLPGRNSATYNEALELIIQYENSSSHRTHNISAYMRSVKSMFLPTKKETSRNTGLSSYIKRMDDFEMQKVSLDFIKKCLDRNIYKTGGVKL